MTERPPPGEPLLAAPVSGFAAFVFAKVLDDELPARLVSLQRQAEAGRLHPTKVGEVSAAWAGIRRAAAEWIAVASGRGSAEVPSTETPPDSAREIDTTTAGAMLGVTPTRVGQLIRAGDLPGRLVGGRWLIPVADVELRKGTAA